MYHKTAKFKKSLYPDFMSQDTYEATGAPFSKNYVYSHDWRTYKYGWMNDSGSYLQMKDVLSLDKFPYRYDIIKPEPMKDTKAFIELIDIPIPMESTKISVYIRPNSDALDKELHFAGSAFWFGVNRATTNCCRCNVTRTNVKVELDEYVSEHGITSANIGEYAFILEGEGSSVGKKKYSLEDIVKDGSYQIII